MARYLLQYHCSGSDTLLGSANVGASIFILLLLGFVAGAGSTALVFYIRNRRKQQLDIEYKERFKDKPHGELPDVDMLLKSARFPHMTSELGEENESDGEDDVMPLRNSQIKAVPSVTKSKSLPIFYHSKLIRTTSGPLATGSQSCGKASIRASSCLLRSSGPSRTEDAYDHVGRNTSIGTYYTDPDSPLPNMAEIEQNVTPVQGNASPGSQSSKGTYGQVKTNPMFDAVKIDASGRLDASASDILAQDLEEKLKSSTFAAPFKSAWEDENRKEDTDGNKAEKTSNEKESLDGKNPAAQDPDVGADDIECISEHNVNSRKKKNLLEEKKDNGDSLKESKKSGDRELFESNPFATTEEAITAAKTAHATLEEIARKSTM